ncbi:unnamed protein product [Blepharisma stoltei]|uniref:Uncharacterized protein n=1 Tax=Blepharisma stoltei TaxID=1481888 RepID=A0AAU9JR29_9CILI|nr:unnamed protein product [Blepharisma stoltei]
MRCRQLPSGDAIAVFTNEKMRKQLLEQGRIVIQQGNQKVNVPVGPVGREGEINYARYLIQVTLPAEVGIEAVTEALTNKCKIVEIIVDNTIRNMSTWYAVQFSPESKYKIYGGFRRLGDAIDLPEEIIIRGKRIYLNHAVSLYCETCGQIGQNSEGQIKIEQRRQERIKIDCIKRKKKEEEKKKCVATAADTLALRMKLEEDKHNNSTYDKLWREEKGKSGNTGKGGHLWA